MSPTPDADRGDHFPSARPLPVNPAEPPPRLPETPRRSLFIRAAGVGLASAGAAVAFRLLLEQAEAMRDRAVIFGDTSVLGLLLAAGFGATIVGAAVALVRGLAPDAAGSGIPHLEGVLHRGVTFRWFRVLWVKVVGGAVGIGGGLALGREGPTIQIGACVGRAGGLCFGSDPEEQRTLMAVGAAAGLSAAFNAPLAGMVFFFEELRGGNRPGDYLAALLASSAGDLLARQLLGQGPIFGALPVNAPPPLEVVPLAIGLGVAGGVAGVLFNVALSDPRCRRPRPAGGRRVAVCGASRCDAWPSRGIPPGIARRRAPSHQCCTRRPAGAGI